MSRDHDEGHQAHVREVGSKANQGGVEICLGHGVAHAASDRLCDQSPYDENGDKSEQAGSVFCESVLNRLLPVFHVTLQGEDAYVSNRYWNV